MSRKPNPLAFKLALAMLIAAANADADKTYTCNFVSELAEVYVTQGIPVGVFGNKDRKYCSFSLKGASSTTGATPIRCKAVDVLAEVYAPASVRSVGVFERRHKKICQFSINGARKSTVQAAEKRVQSALSSLNALEQAGGFFEQKIVAQSGEYSKDRKLDPTELAYLFAAAGPHEEGHPSKELINIVSKNQYFIENCLTQFYSRGYYNDTLQLYNKSENVSCHNEIDNILNIAISLEEDMYHLYRFR